VSQFSHFASFMLSCKLQADISIAESLQRQWRPLILESRLIEWFSTCWFFLLLPVRSDSTKSLDLVRYRTEDILPVHGDKVQEIVCRPVKWSGWECIISTERNARVVIESPTSSTAGPKLELPKSKDHFNSHWILFWS
jgi:hypothetical protein